MSFNENDIRPKNLMGGLAQEVEADRQWLVQQQDRFVEVGCPVCEAQGIACFEKKQIQYQRCPDCDTIFVNPRPPQEVLHEFYLQSRTYAYWNRHVFPASEATRADRIFRPRVDRVLEFCDRYHTATNSLLEIGAGFGTFCSVLAERNRFRRIIALEMTPDLAESCRTRGLEVIESPIESVELPEHSIDVIVSFETLEHLFSPIQFMQSCRRLLAPGGLLVLTCPSGHGFDVITLGTASDTVDHEHLNYLNPDSIKRLAGVAKIKLLEVVTPGALDADIVRNKVLDGSFSLEGQPWLKHILVDKWEAYGSMFQEFLASNMLSSHMWMVGTVDDAY